MTSYDARIWDEVKVEVDRRGRLSERWFSEFYKMLERMDQVEALGLYTELCKVQIAAGGDTIPHLHVLGEVVDLKSPECVRHFCMLIIDNGRIVDMLADCIELRPAERVRLWKRNASCRKREAEMHRRTAELHGRLSAFGMRTRREHEDAYTRLRLSILEETKELPPKAIQDWKKVIAYTPERVGRFDRRFWVDLQLSKLGAEEMKALCHKLKVCRPFSACPQLIERHRLELVRVLFQQDSPRKRRAPCCGLPFIRIGSMRRG